MELNTYLKNKMKPKLEIELVPSSAWYSNLRSILTSADWDTLRKQVYSNAGYECEICGGKGNQHPVECHEVWEYLELCDDNDEILRLQKLSLCQALCPLCHEAKHIGLAQIKGNGERAKETLKRVNGWNAKQVEEYVRFKFSEWHERSQFQWIIDIDKIKDYGLSKYKIKKKESFERN